jgi:hypothetical protein
MDFQEFLTKQEEIYEKNRDTSKVREEGIKHGAPSKGGYLVIFEHPDYITEPLEEFSDRISRVAPAITYGQRNAHTTISDYLVTDLDEFSPDEEILAKLSCGVTRAIYGGEDTKFPIVHFNEKSLYNQSSVITPGVPDETFFDITQSIIEGCKREGIELRMPWGAHMTTARFTSSRAPEELAEFYELMENAPILGPSVVEAINVGYFEMSEKGFKLHKTNRFAP